MTEEQQKLADLLTELYCQPHDLDSATVELVRARIMGELVSGQWAMVTADGGKLWGWISWYCVDDEVFEILRAGRQDELLIEGRVIDMRNGDNLWLATAVVAPWAPDSTYRNLSALAKERNKHCKRVGATLIKRDGREVTHVREMNQ